MVLPSVKKESFVIPRLGEVEIKFAVSYLRVSTAGQTYWKGTHTVVMAKLGFTKAAKELAKSTNILLMNETELENLENRVL